MDTRTKEKIASLFFRYPGLCMLVRTLLYSVWFRLCFIGLLLLPVLLALTLARIWRATPAGFQPVVRISGVDWLQAKSLQRTATKELRLGKTREGIISYSMAVGNNPADLSLVRGFLRAVLERVDPPQFQGPALTRAFWLLRLTDTNTMDLELAAAVFEKYGLGEYLIGLLVSREQRLTVPLQKTYLRVLFNSGRVAEFERFWKSQMLSDALSNDPELQLYQAAFAAGWGTFDNAGQADRLLKEKLTDATWRVTANQIYLLVCERRNETDQYLSGLERLREWKKDRLIDHALALVQNHRDDEADRVLAAIQPKILNESERAVYQYGCLQTLVRQRRYEFARKFLEEIHPDHLFPGQQENLKRLTQELVESNETTSSKAPLP